MDYKLNIRRYRGKVLGKKVISFDQIQDIFTLFDEGLSETAIAKELNCTQPAISQILAGKRFESTIKCINYINKRYRCYKVLDDK